jgi:ATP-dependent Lhr-like helicase
MNAFSYLDQKIGDFLVNNGISNPTPIQEKGIPEIVAKKDVLLLAPTGSGKTEAALLPLLENLFKMKEERELFGFYILYVTPLRALNRDVFKRIESLCNLLGITVEVRHGDTSQYARRKQAITPPNLLIITPETLQAILPGKRLRYHLKTVFAVVVDEIHEIADSKRGTQLSLGLERLEKLVGSCIQRIGLSATVGNPKEVARLLGGAHHDIKTVWAGYESRKTDMRVEMPVPSKVHTKLARTLSYPPHSIARLEKIVELINAHASTLVFTNTRSFAEVLGAKMRLLKPPYEFDVHHGSLAKGVRLEAENKLKQGVSKAIIATSSLELGIDIGQADLVIQYSSPRQVSRALQRVGRAGHGVGRVSKGVILATVNLDDIIESGVILRRAKINKVEDALIPLKPWDVLCQQIAGVLLDWKEITFNDLLKLVQSAYPYTNITAEELNWVLEFMVERWLVNYQEKSIKLNKRTRAYYYEHLSTIPDVRQVKAVDMSSGTSIGVLDEDYVSENVEQGSVFVIRGRPWTVVTVDEENNEVLCVPAAESEIEAPRWIGEMIPVPFRVASEVAKVWNNIATKPEPEIRKWLTKEYGLSDQAQNHAFGEIRTSKEALEELPLENLIIVEDFGSALVLHIPDGTKANEALGIVIASLLTTRLGFDVGVERDPYRILLTSTERIDPRHVVEVLKDYDGKQASTILRLAVRHTQNFASRFIHVARRMNVISRDAKTREIPVRRLIKSFKDSPAFDEAMREVLVEKLDENRTQSIFDMSSAGQLSIHVVRTDTPSPLARLIVEEKTRFEVMGELMDDDEVLRLMEERLLSKRFKLVCMGNGDWESIRTLSTLDNIIECPVCGSKMIAAQHATDIKLRKIWNKRQSGGALLPEEEKEYKRAALIADLVSRYGKKALLVLAGRGVGARTASRILRPGLTERLEILKEIAKAEKEYAKTRPFWDS